MSGRRRAGGVVLWLTLGSALVYELTAFGGIRSPDAELMFRTSESLLTRGTFAVAEEVAGLDGFGLAQGVDGRRYSVFGPAQALAAVPFVAAGRAMARAGWFSGPTLFQPASFYFGAFAAFVSGERPPQPEGQGTRWAATQLNVVVSALGVGLFFLVALWISRGLLRAVFVALLFGFGTLAWPYSGTFLSEPLANLFTLGSFYFLVRNDPRFGAASPRLLHTGLAGLSLGLATATHLSAILFSPFFFAYALHPFGALRAWRSWVRPALCFAAGLLAVLALLGSFDAARFGSVFETGRGVNPSDVARLGYGTFVSPVEGLYGLLFSSNKSLFLFNLAAVAGVFTWPRLHRAHPYLSSVLVAALAFRLLFIASRSDWHGGYCVGPRYLLLMLPYLCLPLLWWTEGQPRAAPRTVWLGAAGACVAVCQQYYFSLGDIFTYYHQRYLSARSHGVDLYRGNRLYLQWEDNPLSGLLDGYRGPLLLRPFHASNLTLYLIGCAVIALAVLAACLALRFFGRVEGGALGGGAAATTAPPGG